MKTLHKRETTHLTKAKAFTIGGLHSDDFHSLKKDYEADGWVLVAFELETDQYHWRARFILNEGQFA